MATLDYTSDAITNKGISPPPTPHSAGEVHCVPFSVTLDDSLADNDMIGLAPLPPDCIPIEIDYTVSDLDEGTAIVHSVGILNEDKDDLVASSDLVSDSTAGQSAATQRRNSIEIFAPATWLAETDCPEKWEEKIVAAKITEPATTATAGTMKGVLYFRAAVNGV